MLYLAQLLPIVVYFYILEVTDMYLDFTGTGGGFSTKLGNTGAYFKTFDRLVLIDCTEQTRVFLQNHSEVMEGVKFIDIILTHCHADHANFGNMLLWGPLVTGNPVRVIFPNKEKITWYITEFLQQPSSMTSKDPEKRTDYWIVSAPYEVFGYDLTEYLAQHGLHGLDGELIPMEAYGYLIMWNDKRIYYSGDTEELPDEIVEEVKLGEIDALYVDCAINSPFRGHMSLSQIEELFPERSTRWYVIPMHLPDSADLQDLAKRGFHAARAR